ncbi:hypothetical protein FDECE_11159 [Fusarium decemcellulare]|nr:hypothetical protein FDECE_11159 [Fusarium decemcellulare]
MESPDKTGPRQSSQAVISRNAESKAYGPATTTYPSPYRTLDFSSRQIRLLELLPTTADNDIVCGFRYVELSGCHPYTALSYTWGDETACREIMIDGNQIMIRENLWSFLRMQSSRLSEPKLFWIDAICINQSNIHERNHQVNLMKQIYANASEVYVWLGAEAENSDLAMDFVAKKGTRKLRPKGLGFHPIWTVEEGRALYDLCDRVYWRRMWIIQEIVHADTITVWCGSKHFKWHMLESLYLTLKALEDTSWFAHHKYAMQVLQSSACVMVWQRAHWRHPDTPTPRLQALIEIFRSWQCADVRDKVYALVGMASPETAIEPDYSKSPLEVFSAVQEKHSEEKHQFYDMLSQLLALPT